MNETAGERRARELAEEWHAGQVDKSGEPYVGHLLRVSAGATALVLVHRNMPTTLARQAAAAGWLHDILEDTDCPWRVLSATVPHPVTNAVMALTHSDGEPWVDYVTRIADERLLAPWVKWADILDNANPERLDMVRVYKPETWKRMVANLPRRIDQFQRVMEARGVDGPWRVA